MAHCLPSEYVAREASPMRASHAVDPFFSEHRAEREREISSSFENVAAGAWMVEL